MGRILVAGEPGNQILSNLAPLPGEIAIDKPGKGMFWATGLHETLAAGGIAQLVFAGVTTEVCVQPPCARTIGATSACTLSRTVITTYGKDTAIASTLFHRLDFTGQVGRQMQTWIRTAEGWRVAAAHVSMIGGRDG